MAKVVVLCVCSGCEGQGTTQYPLEVGYGGISVRPWMGASFRYSSVDSLDMSWLPLPGFESRAVRVAVSRRVRGARVPHPISVGSRRRGISVSEAVDGRIV